jgi:hypothetical protein
MASSDGTVNANALVCVFIGIIALGGTVSVAFLSTEPKTRNADRHYRVLARTATICCDSF